MTSLDVCSIEVRCAIPDCLNIHDIAATLPHWNTTIWEIKTDEDGTNIRMRLFINARTLEEFTSWRNEYEEINSVNYSIRSSAKGGGKILERTQRLNCHHKTKGRSNASNSSNISIRTKGTKNLDCPSNMLCKMHIVRKRYKGQNKELNEILVGKPCEIILKPNHNHSVESTLRFRRVQDSVKDKLIHLFEQGHSPKTALDAIKTEIKENNLDSDAILADRSKCPDYAFCKNLYHKEIKKPESTVCLDDQERMLLLSLLTNYNDEANENCAQMECDDSSYVICLCTPLMKRVHEMVIQSSRVVFMDSFGGIAKDGSRVFILLTPSQCGGLPLGVIIASSKNAQLLAHGFQLLKNIVGDYLFYNTQGPQVILTDDSEAEKSAVQASWPNSKNLLCFFPVLQAIRRWLSRSTPELSKDEQTTMYNQFRAIMFARTVKECNEKYFEANSFAENYPKYKNYLQNFWERKDLWTLAHRNFFTGTIISSYQEAAMRLLKNKIFGRIKSLNVTQLTEFILSTFTQYYERRLLDVATNKQTVCNIFKETQLPPEETLKEINVLSDQIFAVPTGNEKKVWQVVDMAALTCSCVLGKYGRLCKHMDWANFYSEKNNKFKFDDKVSQCRMFYVIATGKYPPEDYLLSCNQEVAHNVAICDTVEGEISFSEGVPAGIDDELPVEPIDRGYELLKKITAKCHEFLAAAPQETTQGLENMYKSLGTMKNPSDFKSACAAFKEKTFRRVPKRRYSFVRPNEIIIKKRQKIHPNGS